MKIESKKLDALSLIEKVIEFESMTPDPQKWVITKLEDNPPRQIRLKQIAVLLQLFLPEIYSEENLNLSIAKMTSGEFIYSREMNEYSKVFSQMDKLINSSSDFPSKYREWEPGSLQYNFNRLFGLKRKIANLRSFNSGIMEISYPYYYAYLLSEKIIKSLNYRLLDNFLKSVIDPKGEKYSFNQLVRYFGYPAEDLFDIDTDWM